MTHDPRKTRRHAFTIIELVVAMAIASIMIFLINRIFFDTTNAISRGVGLSQIIGETRAISSTLTTDFSSNTIASPVADDGFIFIAFKTFTNVDFPSARRLGSMTTRDIQSDQLLMHVKGAGSRTPLTPRDERTYAPYAPAAGSDSGLLWYGHVARLNHNGTDAGGLTGSGLNRFGNNWIVGRQLMFLDNTVPSATTPTAAVYADGPYATSDVRNYTGLSGFPPRYMAMTDVLNMDMATFISTTLDPAATANVDIGQMARLAYVTIQGSTNHRLRVAAGVPIDTVTPANSFLSMNVAQTHPAFITNCSDFQIAFAGDFDADDEIDTDVSQATSTDMNGRSYEYTGGNIRWYGYRTNDPTTPSDYDSTKPPLYDPTTLPGTRFNTGGTGTPIYRTDAGLLADVQVSAPAITAVEAERAVAFRHTTSQPEYDWPHMIRIRYRLHDERGEIESTNGSTREQGIWFEQIIRIQPFTP